MTAEVLNILPFFLYILLLLFIGLKAYRKSADHDEFLLSNRSLSVPALVATIVTTWYGGILGIGEFVYRYGIAAWFVLGLPYYLFAALFAWFLAPRIRSGKFYSIPDILYARYGKTSGILGSLFLIVMTSPAPYILMVAVIIDHFFHFGFLISVLTGTLISTLYVYWGGFRSVVQTDKLQFVLMFSGFIILVMYLVCGDTGIGDLPGRLDALHRDPAGGMSLQTILVWFLIASWTFIDPGFHQRCAAAESPSAARRGILWSILFWFLFDMLTLVSGLYAVVLLSDIEPVMTFPLLAEHVLPPFLQGFFIVSLLAVVMSTVDSYTFLSALTFGRDILGTLTKEGQGRINRYTRMGLILTALISVLLILAIPSVIELWYTFGSLFIPPLLLPVLTALLPRYGLPGRITFAGMAISFGITFCFYIWGQVDTVNGIPGYPFGIEPFFPGLIFSLLYYIVYHSVLNKK